MAAWIRTKSQEGTYQSKQSSTLAPIVYVEVNVDRRFNHYEICPKTLLWGYYPECYILSIYEFFTTEELHRISKFIFSF